MKTLKAGSLEILYENGSLRNFQLNGIECLRMIYFTVRDSNWGTIPSKISNESITIHPTHFLINYEADFLDNDEVFASWKVTIQGYDTNKIEFEIVGEAKNTFKTNRAGFCVLHPIEGLSGQSLQLTHSDGQQETATFPKYIAPFQPFFDLKAMHWEMAHHRCSLDFEGEIFETEDQRNWGDASYKTYCTPLALPFPRTVNKGEIIHQKTQLPKEQIDLNSLGSSLQFIGG